MLTEQPNVVERKRGDVGVLDRKRICERDCGLCQQCLREGRINVGYRSTTSCSCGPEEVMKTAIRKLCVRLVTTLSRRVKPSSASRDIELQVARLTLQFDDAGVISTDRFLNHAQAN